MKRRIAAALTAAALILTLAACAQKPEQEGGVRLYYLAAQEQEGDYGDFVPGSALDTEGFDPSTCTAVHREDSSCPDPGCLLTALLAGPKSEGLRSPFPRGTTLRSWGWSDGEEGRLRVVLSEQYGGLSDISLTLADYCIVLTLCQLEEVETVEIYASGYSSVYRSHQEMTGQDALLDSGFVQLSGS